MLRYPQDVGHMLHHLNIPEGFSDWVLTHRSRVLVGFLLITVIAIAAAWRVPVHVSLIKGVMSDESQYQAYRKRAEILGGDSDDLLYVATQEGDALFTAKVLNAIRAAARDLEELPEIDRVFSIADAPRLVADPRHELARRIFREQIEQGRVPDVISQAIVLPKHWPDDEAAKQRVDFSALRKTLREDPVSGRFLSRDGTAHAMLVWLADSSKLQDKPRSGVREKIEQVLRRHQLGNDGFYCAGTLIILDSMFDEVYRALTRVLPIVALIVSVLVYVTFHRLSYVLLTLVIAGIAISWTLGVVAALFGEITLLVAATPALILIISTADTIHLVSAYVAELNRGLSREEAIRKVFHEVGGACLLTSVTTFVGFLSMMVVPAATLRHMAVAAAVGVASALLLALTLVPMALTILKPPPTGDSSASFINRVLDHFVDLCQRCSLTRPRMVVSAHVLIIVGSAFLASRLEHDADLPARFQPSHHLRQSIDFFNDQMFGTSTVEIMVRTEPEELLEPETIAGLADFHRKLKEQPETRDVVSIVSVFGLVDELIGFETADRLPKTQAAADAIVRVSEQIAPKGIQRLIARDKGLTRIAVQVNSTRVIEVTEIGERFVAIGKESMPNRADVEISGYYPIVGTAVREILKSQLQGFALCFVSVMVIVTLGVRSIRLGLLAALPNLFPLVLLGGFIGLSYDMMDSDFLGIAIVSFGLAVDDTIHFLHRYDIEMATSPDRVTALERTYRYTGSAIIRTTVILGIGLLPFSLSGYLSIHLLGTYLVYVLVFAVLGDLLLLPALVLLFGDERGEDIRQPAISRESGGSM